MILNIEKIYHEYLLRVNTKERLKISKMPGYYSIGGAGSCFLKQMFKVESYKAEPHDEKTIRYFRLGKLIHDDLEKAIKMVMQENNNIEITTEQGIIIEEYGIRGYYDICIIDHKEKLIEVYDAKTMKAYSWKLRFGQVKNRDRNPAVMAELQLATYAIGKLKENIGYTVKIYLIHYKKDDSTIRTTQIEPNFLHSALMYWTEFKEFRSENKIDDILPGNTFNVPVYEWECNKKYCQYWKHCKSPYIK